MEVAAKAPALARDAKKSATIDFLAMKVNMDIKGLVEWCAEYRVRWLMARWLASRCLDPES
jgi:hypothetical protein